MISDSILLPKVLILGVSLGVCTLDGCSQRPKSSSFELYDTLPMEKEIAVRTNAESEVSGVLSEDLRGIFLAVSRTPGIEYEIKQVTVWPDRYQPGSAIVRTHHYLLYLFKGSNGQWHVFRISNYSA